MPVISVGDLQDVYFIVDSESLAHIGYHAFTSGDFPFKTTTGLLKGAFHGFFLMLKNQVERHSPKDMYFCWGDKRERLLRKQVYPEYKAHRDTTPKEGLQFQIDDIKLALFSMGYLQYSSNRGYEGDDVIVSVLKELKKRKPKENYKVVILSNDKDMLQLVTDKISVCTPSHTNYIEYTPEKVKLKYGVPPTQMADYLCLVGDSSDNVPGVVGIGPKTASQLLVDNGNISTWFSNISSITTSDYIKKLLRSNRETMVLSKKLVSLQNYSAPLDKITIDTSDVINKSPEYFFDKYEMTSIRPYDFALLG